MATASELDIIRRYPIQERLATFYSRYTLICSDLNVASSADVQTVFLTAVEAGMVELYT